MRLRALHLTNVRRFAGQRASITGIGDGISVVAQPNEFGKSTFFDALHALFFLRHGAGGKDIRALQPYAGGAVDIAAEIDTDAGAFRVEKRFLSRKAARIVRLADDAIIAQDDEAERWIETLLGAAGAGPAGLLWVRQGVLGLDAKDAAQRDTRRDLLSSVAGEIEAMTGGRRMDKVRARLDADLAQITTPTGRMSGDWRAAAEDTARLEDEHAALSRRVAELAQALADRQEAETTLARLADPAARARREAARAAAETALHEAERHAGQRDAARTARDTAALVARQARAAFEAHLAALAAHEAACRATAEAQAQAAQARNDVEAAAQDHARAAAAHQRAEAAERTARDQLDGARRQIDARRARDEAARLDGVLHKAEAAREARDTARARRDASPATPDWARRAEEAAADVARREAALQARATRLRLRYDGAARVSANGSALPGDTEIALDGETRLHLPGIGEMALIPPASADSEQARAALAQARAALAAHLAGAGAADIAAARALAAARAEAAQAADLAEAVLATLIPDGIDALRAARAAALLAAGAADDAPLPPLADLQAAHDAARDAAATARATLDAATQALSRAREGAAAAAARAEAQGREQARTAAALAGDDTPEARRAELGRADARATATLEAADAALAAIEAEAPDIETLRAEHQRAQAAIDTAQAAIDAARLRRAARDAEIRTLAGEGIEERRDTIADRLHQARARESRLAARAAALIRLRDALDAERAAARDAYFGPVQAELAPLLAILHGDAALQFDSDTLLPTALSRGPQQEAFDDLSGGTREQLAILTRLAFARLFAKAGRHMPIVLDDALVFSDDARIMSMFTALTRVARDQQIIVFTCRQLAFQDLGGARPEVRVQTA
jgi:hypothetical protein